MNPTTKTTLTSRQETACLQKHRIIAFRMRIPLPPLFTELWICPNTPVSAHEGVVSKGEAHSSNPISVFLNSKQV